MSTDKTSQAARDRALQRPELSGRWYWHKLLETRPPERKRIRVKATDKRGAYEVPFDVVFYNGRFFNADGRGTKALSVTIIEWRNLA